MTKEPQLHSTDLRDASLAAAGDMKAFERLYMRHAGPIKTLSRRLRGEAQSDDGVQDVFIRAWQKLSTYRGHASFSTWLYRLALNVLLRGKSKDNREPQPVDEAPNENHPDSTLERLSVQAALNSLTEGIRAVVVLHDMQDHTHDDIAILLGISVSASKMRLHRGRNALRKYLRSATND